MSRGNPLSAEDAQSLAQAKGKTAPPVTFAGLPEKIAGGTSTLLAVNFWKKDCRPCLALQQKLQNIQLGRGLPSESSFLSTSTKHLCRRGQPASQV